MASAESIPHFFAKTSKGFCVLAVIEANDGLRLLARRDQCGLVSAGAANADFCPLARHETLRFPGCAQSDCCRPLAVGQVGVFSADFTPTWKTGVPQETVWCRYPVQVWVFSADFAPPWT